MRPITYKQILDKDGSPQALELWQGDQYITISLSIGGLHKTGFRWEEIRTTIDGLAERAKRHALELTGQARAKEE